MYSMIALLLAAGAVFSATITSSDTIKGVVSYVDLNTGYLVLKNGMTFLLPDEHSGLSPVAGDEVTVFFKVTDENNNLADAIVPA